MGTKLGINHTPISNRKSAKGKSIVDVDLKELAIFSIVRKVSAAQTAMTIQRESDNAITDIDFLAGTPKQREYNLMQGSDGKFGTVGVVGDNATITLDEGIFTVASKGMTKYVNMEWRPLVFDSLNRKIYIKANVRILTGNAPTHIYIQFVMSSGSRTIVEFPLHGTTDWVTISEVVHLQKSVYLTGEVPGAAANNELITKIILEANYDTQEAATGSSWQLDGRVGNIDGIDYSNGAIMVDLGTSNVSPNYDKTKAELDIMFDKYIKPFGFDSGELDVASVVNFCKDTTGFVRTWRDQTGNGYDASQLNSLYMPVICKNNTGYAFISFHGVDDYLASNGSVLLNQKDFTVTTKHMEILKGGQRSLIKQGNQMSLIMDEGAMVFDVNGVQVYSTSHSNNIIGTALSKDDTTQKFYVNGTLEGTTNTAPFTITDTSNTLIGTGGAALSYYNGTVAEVCFYGSVPASRILGGLSGNDIVPGENFTKTNYALDKVLGARAAYALSKLHPNSTKCIRARRQATGQEIDIGFSGKYIDTATLLDFAGYSAVEVMKWYDQSGNSNDLNNNAVEYVNTTIGKEFTIPTSVVYKVNEPDKDGGNTAHRFDTDATALSDIQLPGCINSNGIYSYEFWYRNTNGAPPPGTVIGSLINGDIATRTLSYIPIHSNWRYVKLENVNVTNYSATNNYFSFRIGPNRDITICGLKIVKARSISNRPIIVEGGRLLSGVTFDGSSIGGGVVCGDHMTTAKTNCRCRYIRDYARGTIDDENTHWVEIQAIRGVSNIAQGKPVTANFTPLNASLSIITDGNVSITNYTYGEGTNIKYVTVDLGSPQDIDNIIIYHYFDGRTYRNTKTEISEDGIEWTTVFDSAISGEYPEKHHGNIIFDKSLHVVDDFSVYTGFSTNSSISHPFARIIGKGTAEGQSGYIQNGWSINRYNGSSATVEGGVGDFRVDTSNAINQLARIGQIWDTGHSTLYRYSGDVSQLTLVKDWKTMTNLYGIAPVITSGGVATYNTGGQKLINAMPIIVGGSESQMAGSVKSLIEWDKVLTSEDILALQKCTL